MTRVGSYRPRQLQANRSQLKVSQTYNKTDTHAKAPCSSIRSCDWLWDHVTHYEIMWLTMRLWLTMVSCDWLWDPVTHHEQRKQQHQQNVFCSGCVILLPRLCGCFISYWRLLEWEIRILCVDCRHLDSSDLVRSSPIYGNPGDSLSSLTVICNRG